MKVYPTSNSSGVDVDVAVRNQDNNAWIDIADAHQWNGTQWVPIYIRDIGIEARLDSNTDEMVVSFTGTLLTGTETLGFTIEKAHPTVDVVDIVSGVIVDNELTLTVEGADYDPTDVLYLVYDDQVGDLQIDAVAISSFKLRIIITV